MKRIRINNDIDIRITLKRDGSPENLRDKNILLWMAIGYRKIPVTDFNINENIIGFRFPASSQSNPGVYSIIVEVRDNGGNINTADKCDAFQLVNRSCMIGGTDEPNIQTVSLSYSMDMKLDVGGEGSGGGVTTDYNNLDNKPSVNNVELVGNKSLKELGIQPAGDYASKGDIPNVPDWAMQPNKPSYTASEVGALPDDTVIPAKVSQLENDSGFITEHQDLSSYATKDYVNSQITSSLGVVSSLLDEFNGEVI